MTTPSATETAPQNTSLPSAFAPSFLRLSRTYFTHYFWEEPRKYSRAEAWLDLVRTAAYQPATRLVKGIPVRLERGSLIASIRYLSSRWSWSNTKICQYLQILQAEQMITTEKRNNTTVITLCNYDSYNPPAHEKGSAETARKRACSKPAPDAAVACAGDIAPAPIFDLSLPAADLVSAARAASMEEVVAYCGTLGLLASDGEYLWETWQAGGWTRGGHPIKDWRASARSWKAGRYLPSQKQATSRGTKPGPITALHDPSGAIAAQY